ncbi:terminase [Candidatus Mycolicibacterium alkanivorans]|uniref:Terminase n=1 Tax=Candidatus Mycolicibacterium alkanivorans TaxID=2954114 RepID=A0ABS9YVE3_9MYCO|nr:terminase [Candidatus Mycolicibacterium alkanivorans]MCI4674779.1 terminase [Candidatus Mycolicibacterium alkanivorans]
MTKKSAVPAPPSGTGPSGRALWNDVLGKYILENHELLLLKEMVRTVDLLDKLHAIVQREGLMVEGPHGSKPHPAVVEARQSKIALARLGAALRLPAGDEDSAGVRRPQRRAGARGVYQLRDSV